MARHGWSRRRFLRNGALTGALASRAGALKAWSETSREAHDEVDAMRLFYKQPAQAWPDALPVGNGRLGAMIFGATAKERIQLNEETVWMGERRDRNNPQAARTDEVRALLMADKVHEAEALAAEVMMGIPDRMPCYQTLGDLWLEFDEVPDSVQDYLLELDLRAAVVRTSFSAGSTRWRREVFSSAPRNVIAVRLECEHPMTLTVRLDRAQHSQTVAADANRLVMTGAALPAKPTAAPATQERQVGMAFRAEVAAHAEDGAVRATSNALRIEGARRVTLLVTATTSFRHADVREMEAACAGKLKGAFSISYDALKREHVADYQSYAQRAKIDLLRAPDPQKQVPTNVRVQRVKAGGEDLGLLTLYFEFGRYMLISSSRPGTLPANLQGIWNESIDPPWGSKFTVNINAEMNYWMAEPGNLADLHPQLFDLLDRTRESGAETAKKYYRARGFVVHHNTDIWGDSIPVDHVQAGVWAMGAAWVALHLWEHYAFSQDDEFLRQRAYPILKEIGEFMLDYLVEAPDGTLRSGPSQSPENKYRLPDGSTASLCMSPAMDTQILHAIFDRVARSSELLGVNAELRAQVRAAAKRLPSLKVGASGALQEWNEDYAETEPGHRHISHLFALYPDEQVTLRGTPELAGAARKVLELRLSHGGGSTGWSRAWIINCYARLEAGEAAYRNLLELLRHSTRGNLLDVCGMKANSPFQIDGNLGGAAGMVEMLLQSHSGVVRLLPALPKAWAQGCFQGLRARGGLELDCDWSGGKATQAALRARVDGNVRLAAPAGQRVAQVVRDGRAVRLRSESANMVVFAVASGAHYHVSFA